MFLTLPTFGPTDAQNRYIAAYRGSFALSFRASPVATAAGGASCDRPHHASQPVGSLSPSVVPAAGDSTPAADLLPGDVARLLGRWRSSMPWAGMDACMDAGAPGLRLPDHRAGGTIGRYAMKHMPEWERAYWVYVFRRCTVNSHPSRLSAPERRFQWWLLRKMSADPGQLPYDRGREAWYNWHVDNKTPGGNDGDSDDKA